MTTDTCNNEIFEVQPDIDPDYESYIQDETIYMRTEDTDELDKIDDLTDQIDSLQNYQEILDIPENYETSRGPNISPDATKHINYSSEPLK